MLVFFTTYKLYNNAYTDIIMVESELFSYLRCDVIEILHVHLHHQAGAQP